MLAVRIFLTLISMTHFDYFAGMYICGIHIKLALLARRSLIFDIDAYQI